jgi:probable phosphoglycerate mutase
VQAEALGTVFAADPPSVVVSSDLSRARDTAQAVCDHIGVPLLVAERLRETHYGSWQGMSFEELTAQFPAEFAAWRRWEGEPPEGEGPAAVAARAADVVTEHLPDEGTLMLVTHGGTARALVGRLTELDEGSWWRLGPLGNTCWSTLVEADRGWRLERHNTGLGPLLGPPTGAG